MVLVSIVAFKALHAPFLVDDFPEALAVKVELLPAVFPLHMVSGGLALVLVPLAMALRISPRTRRWHRWAGYVAAGDVAIAGVTAFPVALMAPVTPVSAWGFAAQGFAWLLLLVLGVLAIRRGRVRLHRACMLMMAAVTSGAVFFRLYLGAWALWGDFRHYEAFYAADSFAAWTLPLAGTAIFLKRTGAFAPDRG